MLTAQSFFCKVYEMLRLFAIDFGVSFFPVHDTFPHHVSDFPDIGMEPIKFDMDIIRKGIQKTLEELLSV